MLKLTTIHWDWKLGKNLQDNKKGYLRTSMLLVTLSASKHAAVTGNTLQNIVYNKSVTALISSS